MSTRSRSLRRIADRLLRPGGPAARGADPAYVAALLLPLVRDEAENLSRALWQTFPLVGLVVDAYPPGTVDRFGHVPAGGFVHVTATFAVTDGQVADYTMSLPVGTGNGSSTTVAINRSLTAWLHDGQGVRDGDTALAVAVTEVGMSTGGGQVNVWVRRQDSFDDHGERLQVFAGETGELPVSYDAAWLRAAAGIKMLALPARASCP